MVAAGDSLILFFTLCLSRDTLELGWFSFSFNFGRAKEEGGEVVDILYEYERERKENKNNNNKNNRPQKWFSISEMFCRQPSLTAAAASLTTSLTQLWQQTRSVGSKSARNKTAKWIGTHKEPLTEEARLRRTRKHRPFVLGRDNVRRDFTPLVIPDALLALKASERPYRIHRTLQGRLPVYTDYKNGRSRSLTLIRRVEGDVRQLVSDLQGFLPADKVSLRSPTQHIWIKGNVQRAVRYWLTAIGY